MKKFAKTLGVASLVMTGSTVMMASAMADYSTYQGNGNAYGHPPYTPTTTTTTTTTAPTVTQSGSQYSQYNYRNQATNRYNHDNQYNNGNRYNTYNNGNHYGQYNQNRYATQPQVVNGQPQYRYQTAYPTQRAYPTRPAYPVYNRGVDYRYGYTSRPQWYGRMHSHEYRVLHRDGRDFYYLEPSVYSTGVIIGRPQPGVVLMQYPDRTLEVIEATRLILDVLAR